MIFDFGKVKKLHNKKEENSSIIFLDFGNTDKFGEDDVNMVRLLLTFFPSAVFECINLSDSTYTMLFDITKDEPRIKLNKKRIT